MNLKNLEVLTRASQVADKLLDTPMTAAGRQVAQEAYDVIIEMMYHMRKLRTVSAPMTVIKYLEESGQVLTAAEIKVLCKLPDDRHIPALLKPALDAGVIVRAKGKAEKVNKVVWHYAHAKHVHRYATAGITANLNDSLKAAHAHFFAATGTTQ
ncbi:MAG: hypothetical protein RJA36_914 [Pseudomonadota bacterium]|jgi:hypothetical protein